MKKGLDRAFLEYGIRQPACDRGLVPVHQVDDSPDVTNEKETE